MNANRKQSLSLAEAEVHTGTEGRTGMYKANDSVRLWRLRVILVLAAACSAGCDDLLEVERSPGIIPGDGIGGEGSFQSRFIGAASLFTEAVGSAAVYGGLFTDELLWSGSFVRRDEIDRRTIDPVNDVVANEPYTDLQQATKVAKDLQREILAGNFPRFVPAPEASPELAVISLYSGYTRLYLADMFCTLAFDNTGPEMDSDEVYLMAIEDFTRAIDASDADAEVRTAARVGRARAQLQLGERQSALTDAQQIPEGFAFEVEYSDESISNTVWSFTWSNRRLPVSTHFREPTLDDTGTVDPRVRVVDTGVTSFSGSDRAWAPEKYSANSSPLRIASWEEAQFMIAEIEAGDVARDIINNLRTRNGVDIVWDANRTATDEQILRKIIDEKGRTLLLEAYRMGDMRRYFDQYQIDLFPTGDRFGTQTCMPLPDKERNNNPGLNPNG